MKTILNQLVEILSKKNNELDVTIPAQYSYGCALNFAIGECFDLMEKEKRQIKLNWIEGKETEGFGDNVFGDAEIYFNKKYSTENEM